MLGKYIIIEGIDGAGKTSLVEYLKVNIQNLILDNQIIFGNIIFTREPYTDEYRRLLTSAGDWLETSALFVADRCVHMREVVIPALDAGKIIISDRSYLSNIAYQCAEYSSDNERMERIGKIVNMQPTIPDISGVIFLDIPSDISVSRSDKHNNQFTRQDLDYLDKVRENYHDLIVKERNPHIQDILNKKFKLLYISGNLPRDKLYPVLCAQLMDLIRSHFNINIT